MKKSVQKEVKQLIKTLKLNCKIAEFKDEVDWYNISRYQKLSEDFIREFKDEVDWYNISGYQKLSEDFIREFKDKVNWYYISSYQKLSEDFIREFKDKVSWINISSYQKLSEDFIREFKDKVNWDNISSREVQMGEKNMKRTKSRKICKTCFGFGMWPDGTAGMGPMDASDGMPTIECPECKANKNPMKGEKIIMKWESRLPICCEVCDNSLGTYFIDGSVNGGKWALMCEKCHKQHGNGLGIGKGQKYLTKDGTGVDGFNE